MTAYVLCGNQTAIKVRLWVYRLVEMNQKWYPNLTEIVINEKYEGIYRDHRMHKNIMHCRLGFIEPIHGWALKIEIIMSK